MTPRPGDGSGQRHPDDIVQFGSGRPARHWLPAIVLACLVLAAFGSVVAAAGHQRRPAAPGSATAPPVRVTTLGHRLLGIAAGWQLFARGSDDLLRIQFAQGRITRTYVPPLETASPAVALVVGAHAVVIRPADFVPGYEVPDRGQARMLAGALAAGGPFVPGPPGTQAGWITTGRPTAPVLSLVTLTGHRSGPVIRFPRGGPQLPATAVSDGRGDVVVCSVNFTVYVVGPGWDRPLPGTVVAVGAASLLVAACDALYHDCHYEVVDLENGSQRTLPGPAIEPYFFSWPPTGVIAPDGGTAAVAESSQGRVPTVHLINLHTGATTDLGVPVGEPGSEPSAGSGAGDQSMVWSPDSRWLFVAAGGKLVVVNRASDTAGSLGVSLPPVSEVAIRS